MTTHAIRGPWFSPADPWTRKSSRQFAGANSAVMVHVPPVKAAEPVENGLSIHADPPPLRVDAAGAVRVGRGRITLGLIVQQYDNGMTPEDLVRAYDTLALADVYAVIAYYLRHREEVRAYLKAREKKADSLRAMIEAERPRVSREELLARRAAMEPHNAPTGQ